MTGGNRACPEDQVFASRVNEARQGFLLAFLVILITLVNAQIIHHKSYRELLLQQIYKKVPIPVPRGTIYDRNGEVLASSNPVYSLYLDSEIVKFVAKKRPEYPGVLTEALHEVLNLPREVLEQKMKARYPLLKRYLSVGEYQQLRSRSLPGLEFEKEYRRLYPYGSSAAHVVGFTGTDGQGFGGVERYYEAVLRGRPGEALVARDGKGHLISSIEKISVEPEPGRDIVLTLDMRIQGIVEEEVDKVCRQYRPSAVTVIVMDPDTGEILALANRPTYDPNDPGRYADFRKGNLRNGAVMHYFEPGSIFKIVTAACGLEEKCIALNDRIYCENGKWLARKNRWLHDVHPYGVLTAEDVIVKSSNIGTVKIAMKLGEEKLYDYCRKFGFGQRTGIDLPAEIPGRLRPLNEWSGYSITAIPMGQEVGVTAIQAIRSMAVLANGGRLVRPRVLKEIQGGGATVRPGRETEPQVVSPDTCELMSTVLEKVVSSRGTAERAQILGYRICGKTGTAQMFINRRLSATSFVASFVGYTVMKPSMIVLVTVTEPQGASYGGVVAAPVFREIVWRVLQLWNVAPDETTMRNQLAFMKNHETQGPH